MGFEIMSESMRMASTLSYVLMLRLGSRICRSKPLMMSTIRMTQVVVKVEIRNGSEPERRQTKDHIMRNANPNSIDNDDGINFKYNDWLSERI